MTNIEKLESEVSRLSPGSWRPFARGSQSLMPPRGTARSSATPKQAASNRLPMRRSPITLRVARANCDASCVTEYLEVLRLKRVKRFHSVRVGAHYRALAVDAPDGLLWFWMGTHAENDGLVA